MQSSKALALTSSLLLTAAIASADDLSGRITVGGKPLAGAVVSANLIVGGRKKASVTVTRTGPGGDYALRGLHSGDYILLVDMDGRRVYQGRVALKTSTTVKDIELESK